MKLKSIVLGAFFSVSFLAGKAQTADEVISKYIENKGGADNVRSIKTVIMHGNINQGGNKIPITIYGINNKAFRIEFTFNGMTGYQIITDTAGWGFNPFMGQTSAEPMTADDVKSSQDQLDLQDDLLDYASKGTAVEYLGKDDVEGTECHKLKVTFKNGKEKTYYIGTQDNLLVKVSEKITANGQEMESATTFGNYQKTENGVLMAHSIMNSLQGQVEIDTVEVNKEIDLAKFKP